MIILECSGCKHQYRPEDKWACDSCFRNDNLYDRYCREDLTLEKAKEMKSLLEIQIKKLEEEQNNGTVQE